jgi:hypothetical protein
MGANRRAAIKAAMLSGAYEGKSKKELKKEYAKSLSNTPYTEEESDQIEGWQQSDAKKKSKK